MTADQRQAAKSRRTQRRETVSTLSGAIVILVSWVSEVEPPADVAAALVTLMTILGHKWIDRG